jgi:hypothetical protein
MGDLRLRRRFRVLCKYSAKANAINAKRHIVQQECCERMWRLVNEWDIQLWPDDRRGKDGTNVLARQGLLRIKDLFQPIKVLSESPIFSLFKQNKFARIKSGEDHFLSRTREMERIYG